MAAGRSYYSPGASNTDIAFDPRTDPTAALQALLNQETRRPRVAAPEGPRRPARGAFRSSGGSGGGPTYTAGDAAMALARGPQGRHSFVKNMGGPQQVGGFIATGFQPGAYYGGWDPTDGGPAVSVDPRVPERTPAIGDDVQFVDWQQKQAEAESNLPTNRVADDYARRASGFNDGGGGMANGRQRRRS